MGYKRHIILISTLTFSFTIFPSQPPKRGVVEGAWRFWNKRSITGRETTLGITSKDEEKNNRRIYKGLENNKKNPLQSLPFFHVDDTFALGERAKFAIIHALSDYLPEHLNSSDNEQPAERLLYLLTEHYLAFTAPLEIMAKVAHEKESNLVKRFSDNQQSKKLPILNGILTKLSEINNLFDQLNNVVNVRTTSSTVRATTTTQHKNTGRTPSNEKKGGSSSELEKDHDSDDSSSEDGSSKGEKDTEKDKS